MEKCQGDLPALLFSQNSFSLKYSTCQGAILLYGMAESHYSISRSKEFKMKRYLSTQPLRKPVSFLSILLLVFGTFISFLLVTCGGGLGRWEKIHRNINALVLKDLSFSRDGYQKYETEDH